jgi:hypothetical protein
MHWQAGERVAWTDHDGPERPPRGVAPAIGFGVGAVLAGLCTVLVLADDLCPEHRLWVQLLGGAAIFGCGAGAVALVRGWSSGALIAAGTALCGVIIGLIDVSHGPTRGWLITAAFAVALLGATWLWLRQLGMRQWQPQVPDAAIEGDVDGPVEIAEPSADATEPAPLLPQ